MDNIMYKADDIPWFKRYIENLSRDTQHIVAGVFTNGAQLHRFVNPGGAEYSAIYEGFWEPMNTLRETEGNMINSYCRYHGTTFFPFGKDASKNGIREIWEKVKDDLKRKGEEEC